MGIISSQLKLKILLQVKSTKLFNNLIVIGEIKIIGQPEKVEDELKYLPDEDYLN